MMWSLTQENKPSGHILDYPKGINGVALLDDLDSIAQRRNDPNPYGRTQTAGRISPAENRNLAGTGILIAATNPAKA